MEELKFKEFDPVKTKEWARLTEEEINEIKRRICKHCVYFDNGADNTMGSRYCNYSADTDECRCCSPLECKEKGFFKPGKRGLKRADGEDGVQVTREEAIKTLADIGAVFAEEMGCTEIEEEEAYFGIWEEVRKAMTKRYGEMKTTIISNGSVSPIDDRRDLYVELGFRFGNPRLEVFGRNDKGRQTLAGMELSDSEWNGKRYEPTGDYKYRESQVWGMEGFETLRRMLKMWKERGGE